MMHSHITDLGHDCGTWLPGGRILRPIFSGDVAQEFVERGRKQFGMFLTTVQQVALLANRFKRLEMAAIAAARALDGELIYPPRSLQGVYTDSAGTTKITAVGDVIGGIADKQYGLSNTLAGPGYHATQATSPAKPTLVRLANGNYGMLFSGAHYLNIRNILTAQTDSATLLACGYGTLASPAATTILGCGNTGGVNPLFEMGLNSAPNFRALFRDSAGTIVGPAEGTSSYAANNPFVLTSIKTGITSLSGYKNGALFGTSTGLGSAATSWTSGSIGARISTAVFSYFTGVLPLIFQCRQSVTLAQLAPIGRFAAFLSGAPYA